MIKKGYIKPEELEKYNNALGTGHNFMEMIDVEAYEKEKLEGVKQDLDTGSDTDYDSDEVHDTRSFVIGYYRRPHKHDAECSSEDSEEIEQFKNMLEEPEKASVNLETNILSMPSNVQVVKRISMGHEHLIALVELNGIISPPEAMFGMGSNVHGQLGKDPFRHDFIETLT
jgi:hypothetical protein